MSVRSIEHGTFEVIRRYRAQREQVFAAWASPELKGRWFGPSERAADAYRLDFRVGGREHLTVGPGEPPGGAVFTFDALYQDIVDGERIVYTYEMHREEDRISVSLASVALEEISEGTLMRFVEQVVFLDGHDTLAAREHGTNALMDNLGSFLEAAS